MDILKVVVLDLAFKLGENAGKSSDELWEDVFQEAYPERCVHVKEDYSDCSVAQWKESSAAFFFFFFNRS